MANDLKNKKILFFSNVKTKKMFSMQRFYRTDVCILRDLGYTVKLSNSILDYFLFWKYNFSFIYFYRVGLLPAIISKLFRKKVIFTGGIDFLDKTYASHKSYLIQFFLFNLCVMFSDKNILVSNSDKNNIKIFKPKITEKKYPLSFHVIDFKRYDFIDISKKSKILCTIAWMLNKENVIRKGVDKSIYLFKQLYQLDKEFRMIIIGPNGKGSNLVLEIIKKEKLEKLVTLTGAISESEKIDILKNSQVYTQLSYYEGFGIAAIEALASGNIVVHTGKGGLKDGIGDSGILIENDDYVLTSVKIKELISNPVDYLAQVRKGREHVSQYFRYEKRLNDFQEILQCEI